MEYTEDRIAMLHQIPSPAFFVENGLIFAVNSSAQQRLVEVGTPIQTLLTTGREEYSHFCDGCLYLTVTIGGIPQNASVTAVGNMQLFVLEQDADQSELQSMALAAQALRSPLSSVMSVADQLFPMKSSDDNPTAQAQIARINRGLYQMLRIVCNMSDAYRYFGNQPPRTEIRDIVAIVRELFQMSAPLLEQTGIHLHHSVPQESIYCVVDAELLERGISNILSNAVKFTPKDGTIHAQLVRKGKMLYLTVQDSGSGISPQISGSIYRRYQRIPGLEDGRFGLGLGMVMIRSAAAVHGGTVLTQQGEDFGLRLTMTIPIRQSSDPMMRSPMIHVDYAGERDHLLLELSDCLPPDLYGAE